MLARALRRVVGARGRGGWTGDRARRRRRRFQPPWAASASRVTTMAGVCSDLDAPARLDARSLVGAARAPARGGNGPPARGGGVHPSHVPEGCNGAVPAAGRSAPAAALPRVTGCAAQPGEPRSASCGLRPVELVAAASPMRPLHHRVAPHRIRAMRGRASRTSTSGGRGRGAGERAMHERSTAHRPAPRESSARRPRRPSAAAFLASGVRLRPWPRWHPRCRGAGAPRCKMHRTLAKSIVRCRRRFVADPRHGRAFALF